MTFSEIYQQNKKADGGMPHSWLYEISTVTGVSPFTVYLWAIGNRRPSKSAIKLIAAHLDMTEEELFGERRAV